MNTLMAKYFATAVEPNAATAASRRPTQPLPPMPTSVDTKALSWSRPSLCVNEINEDCGRTFAFTLRKANNVELGLDVYHVSGGKCLTVGNITSGGAIAAWNKQWAGVTAGSKASNLATTSFMSTVIRMPSQC